MPTRGRGDGTPHDWSDAVRFQHARAALDAARVLPLHPTQAPTMESLWELIHQQLAMLEGDPACLLSVPVGPDGASSRKRLPRGPSSGLLLEAAPPPPQLSAVAALTPSTRPPPSSPAVGAAANASVRRPTLQQHPIGTPWSARTKRKCVETGWVPEGTPSLLRPILQSMAAAEVDITSPTSPASQPFRVAPSDAPSPPPPLYLGSPAAAADSTTEASTAGKTKEKLSSVLAGLASEVAAERRAESSFDQWLASEAGGLLGAAEQSKGAATYVTYAAALCAPTPATKRKRDAAEAEAAAAASAAERGRSAGTWGLSTSFGVTMQGVYSALDAELDITDHLNAVHTTAINV